jgi:CRP/FNR family transcriptional regulator, cyclic AMP receptor protein
VNRLRIRAMAEAPVELLQRVPLFADFDRGDLERLARSFKERTFNAGSTVAAEGKGAVGFFVIESGEATVSVRGGERGKLGPGDYFGEIALIDDGTRSATITAKSDLHCYGLTSWEFRPLVESNASIAWKLLETLAKRLRAAQQR